MDLPPDDALRWIVRTYARLRAHHGEAFARPALLQPTGEFFPDEFHLDAPSVERLLRRLVGYSPVADDVGIELAFVEASHEGGGGCGSSACGPAGAPSARPSVQELDDGYRVFVAVNDVGNPDLLTTSLARAVGGLVLHEAGEEAAAGEDEIAAVACGFGVLLATGASVWAKSCGGLRMAQATTLSVEELTVALALFAGVHDVKPADARAHLGATQREAFDMALAWAESNPLLLETLRDRPALLESGLFDLEPVRGLVGRWLHKRKLDRELRAPVAAPARAPVSEDKRRRMEEARALVDEVLGGE
ncbi:MAG TPA: hypothetical protein VHS09_16245 [Polyangiaceae bacterium]|nr:hypothetical protein [Polyangiaceae bacterium]